MRQLHWRIEFVNGEAAYSTMKDKVQWNRAIMHRLTLFIALFLVPDHYTSHRLSEICVTGTMLLEMIDYILLR